MKSAIFVAALALGVTGCDKDDKETANGASIGAPAVKPPVERNMPSGLGLQLVQGSESTAASRMIAAIQGYLKPTQNDAVGALDRLGKIDERMAELDKRATTSPPRICLKETAKAHTHAAALPGSNTFAMKFQCMENLDGGTGLAGEAQMAFGLADSQMYLMERTGSASNAVLAATSLDGTKTEFWQLGSGTNESYIHLVAQDNVGMEFTSIGSGNSALECGVHMKSNKTYTYIKGFDSAGGCNSTEVELCLSATDLAETDMANCTTAKLSTFTLTTLTAAQLTAASGNAKTIIETPITGYTSFQLGEEEAQ